MTLLIADRTPWRVFDLIAAEPNEPATERFRRACRGRLSAPSGTSTTDGATTTTHDALVLLDTDEDVHGGQLLVSPRGERWKVVSAVFRPGMGLDYMAVNVTRWERR